MGALRFRVISLAELWQMPVQNHSNLMMLSSSFPEAKGLLPKLREEGN